MSSTTKDKIFLFIKKRKFASTREIMENMNLARSTVNRFLRQLNNDLAIFDEYVSYHIRNWYINPDYKRPRGKNKIE